MDLKFLGIADLIELFGMSEGKCHRGLSKEMIKHTYIHTYIHSLFDK